MSPPTISKEEQEAKRLIMKNTFDVNKTPVIAIWETTEACGRACLDYGDWIQPEADPLELSTIEAKKMIDDVAELCPPIFVLTGADPLKRADIYPLIRYAASQHLHPVLALHSTPLLTRDAIADLKNAGLSRLVLSLDGASAELHDLICGVHGSFARTMEAIQWAAHWRLTFQITTHFSERNLHDLENIAALLKTLRISQWSVAFPVPSTPARLEEMPSAGQFEGAFARLYTLAQRVPFKIKTSEAPHYRRYILQQQAKARAAGSLEPPQFENGIPGIMPVNEDRGTLFISHTGEVYPRPSLPVTGGNIRVHKLAEIYRSAQVFTLLRDKTNLTGKCGECAFRGVCGGSRARAYAIHGDMFREDPSCIYRPNAQAAVRNNVPQTLPAESVAVEEP
jgi:radical SAM protein with 4Fe4S-binding SPASM domain